MIYIEQELLDNRRWIDFMDVQPLVVGVHVRVSNRSPLARPSSSLMSAHVIGFLQRSGLRSQFAVPVGVGATAGFIPGDFFQFMKLIGITAQVAKFLLAWQARIAKRKRRHLLPEAMVILLADHIEPKQVGAESWDDMASRLVAVLPDLQADLETAFPGCDLRYEVRAQGKKVPSFYMKTTGLIITDNHVLKILKHLDHDSPDLSLLHCEGWFASAKVVKATIGLRPRHHVAAPGPLT